MKFGSIRAVGQVIATGSISSATTTILTGSSQLTNLGYAITGSNTFTGTQTMAGSIIPSTNNTYDLGSPTYQFRHVYISSGSLYVNGTKVLGSTSQELQITTDVGQSFKILEAGSDTITLQSADGNITLTSSGGGDVILDPNTGVIALKGTTTIYSGNKIVSSDGNAIQFGNGIAITGSIVATGTSLVSGSSQITFSGLSGVPSGLISGSAQESGFGYATTGSNTFQGAQTINGSLNVVGNLTAQQYIISSSVTYLTESFASGSHKFGDSADDYHNFTGSVYITGSLTTSGATSTFLNFVSIGTTSSLYPLAVYASTTQTSIGLMSGYSNVAARNWGIATNALTYGDFNLMQSTANGGDPFSAGSSKLYFSPAGYAGINKTTPNTQLDVNGNALVTGSLSTTGNISAGTTINWNGSIGALSYGSGFVTIETNTANAIQLKTNGTTAITISTGQTVTFSNNLVVGSNFQIDAAGDFYQKTTGAGQISAAIANVTYPTFGFYGNTGVGMYRESADTLAFVTSATKRFSISSAGTITAGSAVAATNVEFNLNGVSGKAKRIQFQSSATNQWLLGQGAASETSAFELYNASGTIVLSVDKTSNLSTFGNSVQILKDTNTNGTNIEETNMGLTVLSSSGQSKIAIGACNAGNYGYVQVMQDATSWSTRDLTLQPRGGKVGVGVYNPLTLFHTYSATDNLTTFQAGSSSYGVQLRFRHGASLTGFINSNTTNIFSVYNTNSTEVLSLNPGGDLSTYGALSVNNLWTYTQVGTCTGQSNFNLDVTVGDEGGGGNIFKVEAGFAHYYAMAYNCLAEFYITARGVSSVTTDVLRYDSAYAGSFSATKSDAATLRVTKNAGSYPGGGRYWIRVTKVTY